jgi:hypothetical protein
MASVARATNGSHQTTHDTVLVRKKRRGTDEWVMGLGVEDESEGAEEGDRNTDTEIDPDSGTSDDLEYSTELDSDSGFDSEYCID